MRTALLELPWALRFGWKLGLNDFKMAHRRSKLGQAWSTIGVAIRIVAIGFVFGLFLTQDRSQYFHHVATGILAWTFISAALTSGGSAFIDGRNFINGMATPKFGFPIRTSIREALLVLQNLIIVPFMYVFAPREPGWALLLFPIGLILCLLSVIGLSAILAVLVARFPDFAPLNNSAIGVLFFVTPVIWEPSAVESQLAHLLLGLNPFYHLLQVMRLPLMSSWPTDINWLLSGVSALVFPLVGLWLVARNRDRIGFWV